MTAFDSPNTVKSTAATQRGTQTRPVKAGGAVHQGDTTINVYPTPGMDERKLATETAKQFDARDRARAARGRSKMGDTE